MEGVGGWWINPKPNKNCREGEVWQMCSTAGGTWSIFGLAGEPAKTENSTRVFRGFAASSSRVGFLTSTPSGTQGDRGLVLLLGGEGPVPPPLGLQGRAGEFGWGLQTPRLRNWPLAPGLGWAAWGPVVAVGWGIPPLCCSVFFPGESRRRGAALTSPIPCAFRGRRRWEPVVVSSSLGAPFSSR